MLLLLSHLLTAHYRWRNMEVTLFAVAEDDASRARAQLRLERLLSEARIEARTSVILRPRTRLPRVNSRGVSTSYASVSRSDVTSYAISMAISSTTS